MDRGFLSVQAFGVRLLETHGVRFSCDEFDAGACPSGQDVETSSFGTSDIGGTLTTRKFHEFAFSEGTLYANLTRAFIATGSNGFDLNVEGSTKLPLANAQGCPVQCPKNQTLKLVGFVTLSNLTREDNGAISARLITGEATFSLDEIAVGSWNGRSLPIAAAAATAGALALLKWLVAPLFTRLSKEQALEHPRRKQIFDYIQHNPGANFREIARNTGIAAGTVRHHLNVMTRSDIVVEHQHGSTVRLFENLGRFQSDANWADHVLLREPPLGQLYAWLKANPGAPQKAVLEGMEPQGWSRSTTQHRLARLVDGGLATIRLQGRLKIYTAVDRSAKPPPPPSPFGRPSANPA